MRLHGLQLTVAALSAWLLLPLHEASAEQSAPAAPPPSAAIESSSTAASAGAPAAATAAIHEAAAPAPSAQPATGTQPDNAVQGAPAAARPAVPTPAHPTWTANDIARVRAMLRAARERGQPVTAAMQSQQPSAAPVPAAPVVHGSAGAPFALGFSVDAAWNTNRSYSFFSQHDVTPRFGVWLGHDLLSLNRKLFLGAELGWNVENLGPKDVYGAALASTLVTHTFYGAATLRWVLLPWLQPQARLAGGASLLSMEVTSGSEAKDADHAVSPFGSLGAGVLLRTPTRFFENERGEFAWLSFGILIEAGYALRGPVSLALGQSHGSRDIPVVNAKLGELSLSGAYLRTSLVARF